MKLPHISPLPSFFCLLSDLTFLSCWLKYSLTVYGVQYLQGLPALFNHSPKLLHALRLSYSKNWILFPFHDPTGITGPAVAISELYLHLLYTEKTRKYITAAAASKPQFQSLPDPSQTSNTLHSTPSFFTALLSSDACRVRIIKGVNNKKPTHSFFTVLECGVQNTTPCKLYSLYSYTSLWASSTTFPSILPFQELVTGA